MKQDKRILTFTLHLLGRFLLFIAILIFIGLTLQSKMNDSLNREVEKFTTQQAETRAFIYQNMLQREIDEMSRISMLIAAENSPPLMACRLSAAKGS